MRAFSYTKYVLPAAPIIIISKKTKVDYVMHWEYYKLVAIPELCTAL